MPPRARGQPMTANPNPRKTGPSKLGLAEQTMRKVVDACADCDCCRFIMDASCHFFPEMYRLWDREQEAGQPITPRELRHLADLCNYCALCPCPDIRETIITAKTHFIDRDGLERSVRLIEDVELVGKWCGALPKLTNRILKNRHTAELLKKTAGIHPARKLPTFPIENFPAWARRHKLHEKTTVKNRRKVAYFAGCTARHLFPEVAQAAVEVMQRNRILVYYPDQLCCGMPSMLEGDRNLTLRFARRTIDQLAEVAADGYDIVCSCPTCGYMLKHVLCEKAYYANAYQDAVGGDDRWLLIPEHRSTGKSECSETGGGDAASFPTSSGGGGRDIRLRKLDRTIYGKILKDEGYFSGIDPLKRIRVAENTHDLGEYLLERHRRGALDTRWGRVAGSMVYYPPCHQREQGIGSPYKDLLNLIPDVSVTSFESSLYCCGIAGIMGFKRSFHDISIQMGRPLMAKINQLAPDGLVTDCLSCRLQFIQMAAGTVWHPIEILRQAYREGHL